MITSRAQRSRDRRGARAATIGMGMVLLFLAVFAVFSAVATSGLAETAAKQIRISDSVAEAKAAVLGQGALAQTYGLDPRPVFESLFRQSSASVDSALATMREVGDPGDRLLADRLAAQQAEFTWATEKLFDAVKQTGDDQLVRSISDTLVLPAYRTIENTVTQAADTHRRNALSSLERLRTAERLMAWTTPPAFAIGLLLLFGFGKIISGYQRELDVRAHRDNLTLLPNRLQFGLDVTSAATRATTGPQDPFAVILLDLDGFKEINETLGHSTGDRLLNLIAPRLRTVPPAPEVIARFGGDEFAVLVTDLSQESPRDVAERLRAALVEPFVLDGLALNVEASIGIATFPRDGTGAEELIQHADAAMYVAKSNRLGIAEYDASRHDHNTVRLSLLGELRSGLSRDELSLHYQPVVRLSDRGIYAAEALLRWQHPTRGPVFPDEFIPLAESSGLIHDLTRHVLELACRQAADWHESGEPIPVAVNISARCLLDVHLPDTVAAAMAAAELPAELLLLEITESAIMVDPDRALEVLLRLRAMGVDLAIDDFGTGYTSMAYLRDLPVRELKIDRTFVQNMLTEARDASIVETLIDFAHRLGMTAVAEGIENERTWAALDALGCDHAQGYWIGRPMPGDRLTGWLGQWRAGGPDRRQKVPAADRRAKSPRG